MLHNPIMIMAGGTGGHVYPALAVAEYLRDKGEQIIWLGTSKGLEAEIVPKNNYPLFYLDVSGVRGKGMIKKLISPFIIIRAVVQSVFILFRQKPRAVLGMGGFVSGPGGIAAFLLGIPLCIHEQNAVAGLTNKLLRPFATLVMQAFPNTFKSSEKIFTTGNPVRKEILQLVENDDGQILTKDFFHVLVVGGSLGAVKLNQVVPEAVEELEGTVQLKIRHQTGKKNLEQTRSKYQKLNLDAEVITYIDNMADAYQWADLVICRSGAMTIAELSIVGKASILIPYPYAVDDHQTNNAQYLSDQGFAILIPETELSKTTLAQAIQKLCVSHETLFELAKSVRTLGKPHATHEVAEKCLEVAHA